MKQIVDYCNFNARIHVPIKYAKHVSVRGKCSFIVHLLWGVVENFFVREFPLYVWKINFYFNFPQFHQQQNFSVDC